MSPLVLTSEYAVNKLREEEKGRTGTKRGKDKIKHVLREAWFCVEAKPVTLVDGCAQPICLGWVLTSSEPGTIMLT